MNLFKVTIKLKGATGTPWQADTVFGHLCWVLVRRDGEDALRRFLEPFRDGEPTFLLSEGFPTGFLPRPRSYRLPDDDTLEAFRKNRKLRKLSLLTEDDFRRVIDGGTPPIQDFAEYPRPAVSTRAVLKNQISRLTGTTGEEGAGNLFGFREYWMPEVVIYGKVRADHEGFLRGLFQDFRDFGYGKRRAVGYGAIDDVEFSGFEGFPVPDGANGFVTLSAFIPSPGDPADGRWRLRVKYGRLGEEFAFGGNPFKKPLIMLEPGSAFRDAPVREHYGRMVAAVSAAHPEVVHYGYALPVAARLPEREPDR